MTYFVGTIIDGRGFDRALSEAEIRALYEQGPQTITNPSEKKTITNPSEKRGEK